MDMSGMAVRMHRDKNDRVMPVKLHATVMNSRYMAQARRAQTGSRSTVRLYRHIVNFYVLYSNVRLSMLQGYYSSGRIAISVIFVCRWLVETFFRAGYVHVQSIEIAVRNAKTSSEDGFYPCTTCVPLF